MGTVNSSPINNLDTRIDFVVETGADFLKGNYLVQNRGDMTNGIYPDIISNIVLNFDRLNQATYALGDKNTIDESIRSNYDINDSNILFDANSVYVTGNTILHNYSAQLPIFVNKIRYLSNKTGFIDQYFEINNDNGQDIVFAKNGTGSLPDVIVEAASAALFKRFNNKLTSITNDFTLRYSSLKFFENIINEQLRDTNSSFNTSTIFPRYFNTNRFEGNNINTNTIINYNLDGYQFVIGMKLNGNADYAFEQTLGEDILNDLGNFNNGDTKVQSNGFYQMNILFRITHQSG